MKTRAESKALRYQLSHPNDMPREKLARKGSASLTEQELLAIILRTGFRGKDVFSVSQSVLQRYPVHELALLPYADLVRIKGVGESKAAILVAAFELARRATKNGLGVLPVIQKPDDVVALCGSLVGKRKEILLGFYLNGRNQVVYQETLSVGSLDASIVHPREVLYPAIEHNASGVLLAHNHPSGESRPSPADIEVTRRLADASRIMGIHFLDHVIVTTNGFSSLKALGHVPEGRK